MINFNSTDLGRLNSMTKYPGIPTYHTIDNRGVLQEEYIDFSGSDILVTEKIDGTNARLLMFPDGDYIVGSRDDFLAARGDRIPNPALHIAEVLFPIADRIQKHFMAPVLTVLYGEVYGFNISKSSKQYGTSVGGFRLFDAMFLTQYDISRMSMMEREKISLWRQNGGQLFLTDRDLKDMAEMCDIPIVPRVSFKGSDVPTDLKETLDWLSTVAPRTECALTDDALGRAEGVVIRTPDRSKIAKIRFEDYEKTLRYRK